LIILKYTPSVEYWIWIISWYSRANTHGNMQ